MELCNLQFQFELFVEKALVTLEAIDPEEQTN